VTSLIRTFCSSGKGSPPARQKQFGFSAYGLSPLGDHLVSVRFHLPSE